MSRIFCSRFSPKMRAVILGLTPGQFHLILMSHNQTALRGNKSIQAFKRLFEHGGFTGANATKLFRFQMS
jgi:hypothetical protein